MNTLMKIIFRFVTSICYGANLFILTACASPTDSHPTAVGGVGTTIVAVGHLGSMVGIPNFYVNGTWGGNSKGWGGGGGGNCCVNLPSNLKNTSITVKWETCDISHIEFRDNKRVDPNAECTSAWHEAVVPVHSSEKDPGSHFGLVIHFMPGNKIEAWTSDKGIGSVDYPGPKYPRGPAPEYAKDE